MYHVKHRLRREPACSRRADGLIRKHSVLVVDFHRLASRSIGGSISHQLGVAAPLQTDEPVDSFLDTLADCQKTMVL